MRLRSSALTTTALAALVVLASSAPAGAAVKYTCQEKSASLLFWPKGHGEVKTEGFPAFPVPHLELYGGIHSSNFPRTTNAYMDASGAAQVNRKSCKQGKTRLPSGKVARAVKKKAAANVQCRFGRKVDLVFLQLAGGAQLDVVRDGKRVVEVKLKGAGSSLTFNDKFCDAKPPPK